MIGFLVIVTDFESYEFASVLICNDGKIFRKKQIRNVIESKRGLSLENAAVA